MAVRTPRWLVWSLCAVLSWLTACAATTERVAGWYVTRTIASYLDLTSEQKRGTRVNVDRTIEQLRRTELTHWVSFLREIRQGIHDGLTDEDVARLQTKYDARLDVGVQTLTPRFAPLLASLNSEQVDHFAGRMREDVDKLYEDRKLSPDKRAAKLEKQAIKLVDDFVGDLSDTQEQSLRTLIRSAPNERELQYQAAQEGIEQFRTFMLQRPGEPAIEAKLQTMWERRYDRLGQGRDKTTRRAQQRTWLLSVYRMLTAEQRAHAEEKLTERIVMLKRWVLPSS